MTWNTFLNNRTRTTRIACMKACNPCRSVVSQSSVLYYCLLIFLFALPFYSHSQGEERPKYAPGKEKHRNKTDEFGRKQGIWVYYNFFGEKFLETPWINDHKEGVEKRYFFNGKTKEETEYL